MVLARLAHGGFTISMQALNGVACINGEFFPAQEATVSIFDSGFIGGVSIFDTLACWEGGLFKLPNTAPASSAPPTRR